MVHPFADGTEAAASRSETHEYVHDYADYKSSRFRFKKHHGIDEEVHDQHRSKRRRHHRSRRQSDVAEKATTEDQGTSNHGMDNETAFRESLFDAMADDEGAAYWEGVYGQPIHSYSRAKPADPDNPEGELEQMSDEEYTAYVRKRMWEKTHQHVVEEKKLRDEAVKRKKNENKQRAQHLESEKAAFERQMEESLRKGARRKKDKEWRDAWTEYARIWDKLLSNSKGRTGDEEMQDGSVTRIPWPTRSGRTKDVESDEVEAFFRHSPQLSETGDGGLRSMLKIERVRWHPDRMSNLLRGTIDTPTLQAVTAVFQIVDALYNSIK